MLRAPISIRMKFLIELLNPLSSADDCAEILKGMNSENWEGLTALCAQHDLLSALEFRFSQLGLAQQIPEPHRQSFRSAYMLTAARNILLLNHACQILLRLRAENIPVIALKGLFLLENTYKDMGKMVALELGGKNSTIIHHDTNISHALPELLRACFLTSGQRCTSTSMILVHRKIEQEFISQFKALTERIKVGHPTKSQGDAFMGPLIDAQAEKLYFDFCQYGKDEGAEDIVSARKLDVGFEGHYVSPSIHYAKKPNLNGKFIQEEIFGPNCFFVPYDDIEEAIKIANCTPYGLAASVFTRDPEIYNLCLRDIDSGLLNLNRSTVGATARLPFGGVKDSGNHRPAAVSMIDACVSSVASLETLDDTSSKVSDVVGLKD